MEYGTDDSDADQSDDVSSIEPVEPDPDPIEESTEDFTEPSSILMERLREIKDTLGENKGYIAAAVVVGVAVTALAVAKKKGMTFHTPEGSKLFVGTDQHSPDTISLIELSERKGPLKDLSISFPVSAEAAKRLQRDSHKKRLFAMGVGEGFVYPLQDEEDTGAYMQATKKAAGWLLHIFRNIQMDSGNE